MNEKDQVILVDEVDREIGVAEKLAAHENGGRLHRAFSIFVFDGEGRLLLQRRALAKYHFAGLWTNTCCSHPRPGEAVAAAARRRLREEFGFETELTSLFTFVYHADDPGSGLMEREFDHVFVGRFCGAPAPNPDEIDAWEWRAPEAVLDDLASRPERYTPWFRIAFPALHQRLRPSAGV